MKRVILAPVASLLLFSGAFANDSLSMSEADKALYSADENPGDLFIAKGEEIFKATFGSPAELAKWLGIEPKKLPAEIATYPKYMAKVGKVIGLDQMLQLAMHEKGKTPFKLASNEMTWIVSYVKSLANDLPMNVDIKEPNAAKAWKLGETVYMTRRGQRGLSCYSCHSEKTVNMRLRMQILPDLAAKDVRAGSTWPAYRMTKSAMTTLQKRFQGCMENSSMAKLPLGSDEMVGLELYVNSLSNGHPIAIPGLKR